MSTKPAAHPSQQLAFVKKGKGGNTIIVVFITLQII